MLSRLAHPSGRIHSYLMTHWQGNKTEIVEATKQHLYYQFFSFPAVTRLLCGDEVGIHQLG